VLGLYEGFGYDPVALSRQTEAFLGETESLYRAVMEPELRRRTGVGLDDATPADVARMFRAPEWDRGFPLDRAVPALRATLLDMGIDLDAQRNVVLDVDARPGKVPRAFCAPVRVPDRVFLVILPQGGQDDYRALFHEAGHTEHFANTDASLPAEHRVLGDNGVTEGWAFLLEHLVSDPAWLSARLDFSGGEDYVRFSALERLFFVRRYCAKLAYELELHSGKPLAELPALYAERLSAATGVRYPEADHLDDVDEGFYVTCYLRAWGFEAQLRQVLAEEVGSAWFRRKAGGDLLRELWSLGQAKTADELLDDVAGAEIDLSVLADELRERLA
jgi:hypothetical protein